jgi:hypothetical protein
MKLSGLLLSLLTAILSFLLFNSCSQSGNQKQNDNLNDKGNFYIGWASANITPDKPVLLAGQFHARVSDGVRDSITATALAIESGKGENSAKAILISCDLVSINDNLRDEVRKRLKESLPEVKPEQILINATHTHTAPLIGTDPDSKTFYGVELEAMSPAACLDFVAERIANAAEKAWKERKRGGISFGLGQAVVGHNRLRVTLDGKSTMYGKTNTPDFSHLEGLEDHSVNLLYTWNLKNELTGVVINLASSSQVSEQDYLVSADYWCDTRSEVRKRLGDNIFILPQCSAAGDQSPHVMVGDKAEARMQRLMFPDSSINVGRSSIGQRKQIAVKIADAVTSVLPYMTKCIDWDPKFGHLTQNVELSRRLIGMEDVNNAVKEAEGYKKQYDQIVSEINSNPSIKQKKHWYFDITRTFTLTKRGKSVRERFELEKKQPKMPVEVHVLRIGDVAIATNPFELYLDYGMRMKGRSPAVQTFLVQLTGSGSYLPVARSVAGGSYGAVPASTLIGPDGGQELVESTLNMMNELWPKN